MFFFGVTDMNENIYSNKVKAKMNILKANK